MTLFFIIPAWKYIHYEHFRPQLFDLNADPDEFHDLGVSPAHAASGGTTRTALYLAAEQTYPHDNSRHGYCPAHRNNAATRHSHRGMVGEGG